MGFPAPTPGDIRRVVDIIVEVASPHRIVLFGSGARAELREGSDRDVMVVVPDEANTRAVAHAIYEAFSRLGVVVGVDLVVTTPKRWEQGRRALGSVLRDIDRDGHELFAA